MLPLRSIWSICLDNSLLDASIWLNMVNMACPVDADMPGCSEVDRVLIGTECDAWRHVQYHNIKLK